MTTTTVTLEAKESALKQRLRELGSVVVAYSGGVDSSLLAYYAKKELGARAQIVIALSASLAQEELSAARAQAQQFDFDLVEIATNELSNPDYARNDERRCYFCKKTLFRELELIAGMENIQHIAYGANVDDMQDYRPGHAAAREFKVISPLQDAGMEKSDIRELAKSAGLPSWNRPQAACLASRLPTFEPVTVEALSTIDKAEAFLHSLGFAQVRVRHYGDTAKVEIDAAELPRLMSDSNMQDVVKNQLMALGYSTVEIDPRGYRRGSANTFLNNG